MTAGGWGFQIGEVRRSYLSGRYVVREKRTESFRNPIGEIQTVEFQTFRETEFRVQDAAPHVEVPVSARGTPEVFNQFGRILNYKISIASKPQQLKPRCDG